MRGEGGTAKAVGGSRSGTSAARYSLPESSQSLFFSASAASRITHARAAPSFTDAMRRTQIR